MNATSLESPAKSIPLSPCPPTGRHSWLLAQANRCRNAGLPAHEAERLLAENINRPPTPANEIQTTVAKAYGSTWTPSGRPAAFKSHHRAPVPLSAVAFNPDKLAAIAGTITAPPSWRHWLWARSPKRPETQNAFSFLAHLYRDDEHVHVFDKFESKAPAHTLTIQHPMDCRVPAIIRAGGKHGLGCWFLNTPVDGGWHDTGELDTETGEPIYSCRNWQAVTSFRYAVLESDQAPFGQWLAFIVQLPLRVAAIYTSGGRSIHTLIRLDAANKAEFDATMMPLKRPLKVLGADPACLSAVRLTRLPGCWRPEKDGFQRLLYLCPNPPDVRLADLPVLRSRFEALDRWQNLCPRWNQNQEAEL